MEQCATVSAQTVNPASAASTNARTHSEQLSHSHQRGACSRGNVLIYRDPPLGLGPALLSLLRGPEFVGSAGDYAPWVESESLGSPSGCV